MALEEMLASHRAVVTRFCSDLEADDGARPVRGLTWTVSDLGAHLLSFFRAYQRALHDDVPAWPDLGETEAHNRAMIDATPERAPAELAAAMRLELDPLHEAWRAAAGDVLWHADVRLPAEMIVAINIADFMVHHFDLLRGRDRLRLEPGPVLQVMDAMYGIAPLFVDEAEAAGLNAAFHLRLRPRTDLTFIFVNGTLEARKGRPGRADCHIVADPVAFMLVWYGRRSPVTAALAGEVFAYGRKPWLGLRLTKLFRNP